MIRKTRRRSPATRSTRVAALALVPAMLAACGTQSGGAATVKDGVTTVKWAFPAPVASLLPLYLAGEIPSICKPFGIKVKPVALDPSALITAVASGSVELSENAITGTLAAAEKSPKSIQMVALTGPQSLEMYAGKSINSVAGLRGKTIAVTAAGASSDIYARGVLTKAGLKPEKDVKLLYTKIVTASIAQVVAGNVDALPTSPPIPPEIIKAGFHELPEATVTAGTPLSLVLAHAIGVNPRYAAAHKDVITNSLKCLNAAMAFAASHPKERDAALVKYTGTAAADAENAYEGNKVTFKDGLQPASASSLTTVIDTLVSLGTRTRSQFPTPVEQIVDESYLK